MPAHLVTPRWKIADSQDLQAVEQDPRIDAERRAKVFEAENISASGASHAAFEPGSYLDELPAVLTVFRVDVSQVASNCVFEDGQQKFQLALEYVISPNQIDVLLRKQQPRVVFFLMPAMQTAVWRSVHNFLFCFV